MKLNRVTKNRPRRFPSGGLDGFQGLLVLRPESQPHPLAQDQPLWIQPSPAAPASFHVKPRGPHLLLQPPTPPQASPVFPLSLSVAVSLESTGGP